MNPDLAIIPGLLAAVIAMFALNKPRMDAVGLIMLAVLPLTGVISVNETIAEFSDPKHRPALLALCARRGPCAHRSGPAAR